ncbi:restriction endonuclease subunit S [uncultured Sphaerotilus sp.]|uniref:restriction endonuclease subunit S n=1 Tax=uncultured Sphaerotilus sp. TaxID=474984 RepID=UPI0030CA3FD8
MEVKPGYKQTDAGVIPTEWSTRTIIETTSKIIDYRGRTPRKLGMDWGGGDIPALSARNVKCGFIDFSEECYLGSDALYTRWMTNGDAAPDDIVFTTEAPLGNVALIPDERRYILSQRTILLKANPTLAFSPFLFQLMLSDHFQKLLSENSSGSTAQGIKRKKFEQLQVTCPPVVEQRAIAEALSDVDALLAGLDRLIAKKRHLKQAAAQQLLTGQTRLPGFGGKWERLYLGNMLTVKATYGIVTAGEFKSNGIPMVRAGDIKVGRIGRDMPFVSHEKSAEYERTVLRRNDVVIALVGYPGEAARVPVSLEGANISRAVGLLRLNSRIMPDYLVSYLNSPVGRRMVLAPSAGSAQLVVNLAELNKLRFSLPPVPEQTAIAAVLSDMDAELSALETRRDKTRALKQAMMQELLTGRTRLI